MLAERSPSARIAPIQCSQSAHKHLTLHYIDETDRRLQSIPAWYRALMTIRPTCEASAVSVAIACSACQKELAHSCLFQDSWPPETWSCLSALAPVSAHDRTWQDAKRAGAELFLGWSALCSNSAGHQVQTLSHSPSGAPLERALKSPVQLAALCFAPLGTTSASYLLGTRESQQARSHSAAHRMLSVNALVGECSPWCSHSLWCSRSLQCSRSCGRVPGPSEACTSFVLPYL